MDLAVSEYIQLTVCCELTSLSKVIIVILIVAHIANKILVLVSSLCIIEVCVLLQIIEVCVLLQIIEVCVFLQIIEVCVFLRIF